MGRFQEITALSGLPSLAEKKQFYTVPDFKIGGTYEIGRPDTYEFGGQGGTTLESLGAEPLRTSYIAVGTPKWDSSGRVINAVLVSSVLRGRFSSLLLLLVRRTGRELLFSVAGSRSGKDHRYEPFLRDLSRCARPVGREQTQRRAGYEVPPVQHVRLCASQLSFAER